MKTSEVTVAMIASKRSEIEKNCMEGFIVNPNEKVVTGIIKGLFRCDGECPCANTGETLEDRMCPCKNYREEGHCCCHLYLPVGSEDEKEDE